MNVCKFIDSLTEWSKGLDQLTYLHLLDEDTLDTYYIKDVCQDEDTICFTLSTQPSFTVTELLKAIKDMPLSAHLIANYKDKDKYFEIKNRWYLEDETDPYVDIYQRVVTPSDINDTKQYEGEFKKYEEEKSFTNKLKSLASKAGIKIVYIAYWIYYALTSGSLTAKAIAIATGSLGYLFSPIDAISDFLPFIGFSDDIAILTAAYYAIYKILATNPKELEKIDAKAKSAVRDIFGEVSEEEFKI